MSPMQVLVVSTTGLSQMLRPLRLMEKLQTVQGVGEVINDRRA